MVDVSKSGATIVVGGFYGDEGKGKVIGYLALKDNPSIVVRAGGGPQAGHTVTSDVKVTQVPSGLLNLESRLLIARGTAINPRIVLEEGEKYNEKYNVMSRLGIDKGCTIITDEHIRIEKEDLCKRIGSVGSGTGPARVDRLLRRGEIAKTCKDLEPYLTDVAYEVNNAIAEGHSILIEGVQGFGLSLLDHEYYPFVTSQDTTASQFAADTGIGPKAVQDVVVVYKAYVSRVGEGFLNGQWTEEKGKKLGIVEHGAVSGRRRRIADFDKEMALNSAIRNSATIGAITCIDRLFPGNTGKKSFDDLTLDAQQFIEEIHTYITAHSPYFQGIKLISTGPNVDDMIDLR